MKKHLLIFGTSDFNSTKESLRKSSTNFFDNFHIFSDVDIDENFSQENKNILSQKRGAGYWLWKPYFIDKVLSQIEYEDILFYVDSSNIFLKSPDYIYESFESDDIILFDNRDGMPNNQPAQNFISCKKDIFVLMSCDTDEYINGLHVNAAYSVYKKTERSINFVKEWLEYCKNEEILTDTPNRFGPNYPGYYEHRHDQSVLALLAIKNNINLRVDPSQFGENLFYHHRNKNYTI